MLQLFEIGVLMKQWLIIYVVLDDFARKLVSVQMPWVTVEMSACSCVCVCVCETESLICGRRCCADVAFNYSFSNNKKKTTNNKQNLRNKYNMRKISKKQSD